MPQFSVIVPAYNAEATLAETLDSVVGQACRDWECVVVDDGSVDSTAIVAMRFADSDTRIRVITQGNQGTGGAYNTGVAAASGDMVVICSADDMLLPTHLSSMSSFVAENPRFDIFSCNGFFLHKNGTREIVYRPGERDESMSLVQVIEACFFSVGAAYRRTLFKLVGGYRPGVFGEDYDFWLRCMAAGAKHRYLDQPLVLHRLSDYQKSASAERVHLSDIAILSDLRTNPGLSDEERTAIDEGVEIRRRLITDIHGGLVHRMRLKTRRTLGRLLGEDRARRVVAAIRDAGRMRC